MDNDIDHGKAPAADWIILPLFLLLLFLVAVIVNPPTVASSPTPFLDDVGRAQYSSHYSAVAVDCFNNKHYSGAINHHSTQLALSNSHNKSIGRYLYQRYIIAS